jgi:acyl carrier protein
MTEPHARNLTSAAVENQVREIWNDVLNVSEGEQDLTFFDLQGQSISAVRIVARVEDELGVQVDVGLLFEDPDLTTFTRHVLENVEVKDAA